MKVVKNYILSRTPIPNLRQLTGQEAQDVCTNELGLKFVHVDDDGRIQALTKELVMMEGCHLYEKKNIATM